MRELITYIVNTLIASLGAYFFLDLTPFDHHFGNYLLAFILIYGALWLLSFIYDRSHFVKLPRAISLMVYFFKELIVASLVVAWDVITPRSHVESGVIALPLDAKTNFEITLLASLISLTPGTLSLDVSEDRRTLFVHAGYIKGGDVEGLKKELKEGFERRLLEITRKYYG